MVKSNARLWLKTTNRKWYKAYCVQLFPWVTYTVINLVQTFSNSFEFSCAAVQLKYSVARSLRSSWPRLAFLLWTNVFFTRLASPLCLANVHKKLSRYKHHANKRARRQLDWAVGSSSPGVFNFLWIQVHKAQIRQSTSTTKGGRRVI